MAVNERRLTGRDVLNKTFQAKTKRGYDPVEVDAYLELVAAQVDMLHGDVAHATEAAQSTSETEHVAGEQQSRLDDLVADNYSLQGTVDQLTEELERARAENEQLRIQVSEVAPPPPGAVDEADSDALGVSGNVPAHAASLEVPREDAGDRAAEESYELVLRMARRSAEETIAEAHARADEIVADANFTASQISRESDRKAFETANAVQAELAEVREQIDLRQAELSEIQTRAAEKRQELRDLANRILLLADEEDQTFSDGADVVDLRPQTSDKA